MSVTPEVLSGRVKISSLHGESAAGVAQRLAEAIAIDQNDLPFNSSY
jgi:hypothetical protein